MWRIYQKLVATSAHFHRLLQIANRLLLLSVHIHVYWPACRLLVALKTTLTI